VHFLTNAIATEKVHLQRMGQNHQFRRAVKLKCPRCGEGELFTDRNHYNLSKLGSMPRKCDHCGLKFEPETGFYYGAMWVSYLIGVFLSLIIVGILIIGFKMDTWLAFVLVVVFHLLFSPYLFRLSRAFWLSFYVHQHKDDY